MYSSDGESFHYRPTQGVRTGSGVGRHFAPVSSDPGFLPAAGLHTAPRPAEGAQAERISRLEAAVGRLETLLSHLEDLVQTMASRSGGPSEPVLRAHPALAPASDPVWPGSEDGAFTGSWPAALDTTAPPQIRVSVQAGSGATAVVGAVRIQQMD